MELNRELLTGPVRDAATVVMLRDTAQGMEVFLLKRHGLSDVLGGAYVFPGGKVDALDSALDARHHLDQFPQVLHATLNEPAITTAMATSLYVAALREAFEESGVLFAQRISANVVDQACTGLRTGTKFNDLLKQLNVRLDTQSLVPWSRWVTPKLASVSNKRFDTRFFVAAVPPDQIAQHDNHEATESVWLSPRAALTQYWDGQIELAPPQIMSLAHLARHTSVASVLTEARNRKPPTIEPQPFEQDGVRILTYPGDERNSLRERVLPGPTRLQYRNKRFEPIGGFEGLFN